VKKAPDEKKEQKVETELRRADPRSIKPAPLNSRYMSPAEFRQLVENVRADGKLSSVPLVYLEDDGALLMISGHHRTEAAAKAGIDEIDVMVITTRLTPDEIVAKQLSHNAINGKDDPSLLAKLYAPLSVKLKLYSGVTDDDLGKDLKDIDVSGLSIGMPSYEQIELLFLPEDGELFEEQLERIEKSKIVSTLVADIADFDAFFAGITKTKDVTGVKNSALALRAMAHLALERLSQLEAPEETPS
jgi:hypothetical protein